MELEQLRQLEAVARCGTISAAAKALRTTQPSLSRSMKKLEADLGQELFSRTRNRAVLNDAGRLAVEHAGRVLAEERRMREAFDELAKRQRTVRVASVAPAPNWRLGSIVVERFSGVVLEPDLVGDAEAEHQLANRACDLAITRRPIQLPTVACVPFMTEDLYFSAPNGHRLAKRGTVSFDDLNGETFLVFEQIGFWMEVCRRFLPDSQIIVQKDRMVFMQLINSTELCYFTTLVPENDADHTARAVVPIADAEAHATFFLCKRADAPDRTNAIFQAATQQGADA